MKKETTILCQVASYALPITIVSWYVGYSRLFMPAVHWHDEFVMLVAFFVGAFLQLFNDSREKWIGLMFYSVVMVVFIPILTYWIGFQFFGAHL